jgi:hypothetical protein
LKFKEGDKVECISSGGFPLTVGKIYTVMKSEYYLSGRSYIDIINDVGVEPGGYNPDRFVLSIKHMRDEKIDQILS